MRSASSRLGRSVGSSSTERWWPISISAMAWWQGMLLSSRASSGTIRFLDGQPSTRASWSVSPGLSLKSPETTSAQMTMARSTAFHMRTSVSDFIAVVDFVNPYPRSTGTWDYGIAFRDATGPNDFHAVVVDNGGGWQYFVREGSTTPTHRDTWQGGPQSAGARDQPAMAPSGGRHGVALRQWGACCRNRHQPWSGQGRHLGWDGLLRRQ